jgi:SAM-dependent methyltransferase
VEGDAEKLPFEDASFDAYTIVFGIRNVTDIEAALREAYRRAKAAGFPAEVVLLFGLQKVPVKAAPFDACTIVFGILNNRLSAAQRSS